MFRHAKTVLDVLSTLLVLVAGVALLWRLYSPAAAPGAPKLVEDVKGLTIAANAFGHARGSGEVALVEFEDFECPFCARHATTTAPRLEKEWIESGKAKQVFLNFPLPIHPRAQKAGEAAECAAQQGRFWEMRDRLFKIPSRLEAPDLAASAETLGLDEKTFAKCLKSGATAARLTRDSAEGRRLGVSATPAFFIGVVQANGTIAIKKRINGAAPFKVFETALKEVAGIRRAEASSPRPGAVAWQRIALAGINVGFGNESKAGWSVARETGARSLAVSNER